MSLSWTVRRLKQTRRNYWTTRRVNACRDVNILKFSPRPGTHFLHPHDAHCQEFFPHWDKPFVVQMLRLGTPTAEHCEHKFVPVWFLLEASLTSARWTVYARSRNLACQERKNSWWYAWGCVAMRAGEVMRNAMSWQKFWSVHTFSHEVTACHYYTVKLHAWISWTVRKLCVTDGTTWHNIGKLCVNLLS